MAGKGKNVIAKNYLDNVPVVSGAISWRQDDEGIVTIDVENKGVFNKIAQVFFGRPRVSHIHLDGFGSFVWQHIDGKSSIYEIGKAVDENFGEKVRPLYERLAKFFQILDSYKFIKFVKDGSSEK